MSGMMLHGLGDCTPELNCGRMAKSPRDVLRDRIARALYEHEARTHKALRMVGWDEMRKRPSTGYLYGQADAVIAALRLEEEHYSAPTCNADTSPFGWHCAAWEHRGTCEHMVECRRYVTPWERIEGADG